MIARASTQSFRLVASSSAQLARQTQIRAIPAATRSVITLGKTLYTAHAKASGEGRNGITQLVGDDGGLEVSLGMPKSLGGTGAGNNPEQLFGLGYSACFLSALQLVARNEKASLPKDTTVDAKVHIGPPSDKPGFAIAVDLIVSASTDDKTKLKELVDKAHEVCPYSNATRGNVPVTITVE